MSLGANSPGNQLKSIYLILGKANTRKSSLVRNLIGKDNSATEVDVLLASGLQIHIRGFISAAQEKELMPEKWVSEFETTRHWHGGFASVRNVIATLRYDAETANGVTYPPGEEYVDSLLMAGWDVKAIISLGEPARSWVRLSGLPNMSIPESQSIPTNALANRVRQAFCWE